jgi:L-fuconolactonase
MEIIDSQLHEVGPRLAWPQSGSVQRAVMTEILLGWMDAVGVDVAILNPQDETWGDEAVAMCPERFVQVVSIADPTASDVGDTVSRALDRQSVRGLRIVVGQTIADRAGERGKEWLRSGSLDGFFSRCEGSVPVFVLAAGNLLDLKEVARRYPGLTMVIDHLGIRQPPLHELERDFSELLPLAKNENVAVKMCGTALLSDGQFPFSDAWDRLKPVRDAFGAERLLWASDISRFQGRIGWGNEYPIARDDYKGKHNYAESLRMVLDADTLTNAEKELMLGGAARLVLGWPRA